MTRSCKRSSGQSCVEPGMPFASLPAVVAIPVKDEAERIGACLQSVARQREQRPDAIVLVINNTSDGTADVVRSLLPTLPVPVHAVEHRFAAELASAGAARQMAMERSAALLGEAGALLCTDADGRVPDDWVAANLYHLRHGLDAVAGRAVLDPAEAALIPAVLHADDALECRYAALLDEIAAVLDPLPWDKLPRHREHSGASIAVTLEAYRRAGGMEAAPIAEDRRFFAALARVDARIRHAPEIEVVVSGRTVGRAEGGMADTIRRRLRAPDPYLDDALEPVAVAVRRARLRARFRRAWASEADFAEGLAGALAVPAARVREGLAAPFAGAGWAALEAESPALRRQLVPAADVERATVEAEAVLRALVADDAMAPV